MTRTRPSIRRWRGLPLLAAVAAAPGCDSTPARPVALELLPLSATSWSACDEAIRAWAQINASGLGGDDRAAALTEVYTLLRQAQENSADSPLLQTRMAETLMEIGPSQDDAAKDHLLQAVRKEPDWAPAWYEAAWLVLRREDPSPQELAVAADYVAEFEGALDRLVTWNPAPHDEDAPPPAEVQPGFYDVQLPDAARQMEFLRQIGSYLEWRKTNTLLLNAPRGANAAGGAAGRGWDRALRARGKFLKLLIEMRQLDYVPGAPSPPARLQELAMLLKEEVLPLDGDFVHPRRARAEILHALSFHTEASDVIQGLVDRGGPMLANDPDLLYLALRIHADWLADELERTDARFADSADLQRLDALVDGYALRLVGAPHSPDGAIAPAHRGALARRIGAYLDLVEHAVRTGQDDLYGYAAVAAEAYVDAASRRLPGDRAEIEALRERLLASKASRSRR